MNKNVGHIDRGIRVVVGAGIIAAGVYFQNYWGAIGLIPFITGIIGWCPAYKLFGLSSCKVNQAANPQ